MHRRISKAVIAAALSAAGPVFGWSAEGHRLITRAALEALTVAGLSLTPADAAALVEAALQPDLMRPRRFAELRDREAPEHYLDLERLRGRALPPTRSAYIRLVVQLARTPDRWLGPDWTMETVGTLPYAVVEGTQRLAVAFAQVQQRWNDPAVRSFAMLQAGLVAHYAQDLCQPLHTTVHFDGHSRADGTSPESGIHRLVDGLLQASRLPPTANVGRRSRLHDDLFATVTTHLRDSHQLVDTVYRLEPELRALEVSGEPTAALRSFASARFRDAAGFTADLMHTAWALAATVDLPEWQRAQATPADAQP